ncbi:cyclopropane-fatty-acyl-phospholipid synthase family protein [Roseiflexus sp.]|uniref:SAM-dependent methyltransferase n=1 Tax=Roseiflexus sp. TaxID=2562120 RepID=UPI0021DDBF97|nr:class I SAM-dependent methyltransferase [Roseiflexus sp.]GIW01618.1 MAG: type 11 methyltransferase [Roseiflexus sp.]
MTDPTTRFQRLHQRYRDGDLPWDHDTPPPEVMAIAESLPPGRALDLGCGTGRACVYLAARGWHADGVDFIPEAIARAEERVHYAGVADRVRLFIASVTDLHFLREPYDLVIDVGCMHGMTAEELYAYAGEVARLTRSGGLYLLFAHLHDGTSSDTPRWIAKGMVEQLFAPDFEVERIEYGVTHVCDTSWPSAWYWLRRR